MQLRRLVIGKNPDSRKDEIIADHFSGASEGMDVGPHDRYCQRSSSALPDIEKKEVKRKYQDEKASRTHCDNQIDSGIRTCIVSIPAK